MFIISEADSPTRNNEKQLHKPFFSNHIPTTIHKIKHSQGQKVIYMYILKSM